MAATKQTRNTNEARAATKARNAKRDAEALALASDEGDEGDETEAEHGSQWATERSRIAQGTGKGSRFVALAAALADCYAPGATVPFDTVAAATAGYMPNAKPLQRSTVGSWRTLLQRARQTGVDVCGASIAPDGSGFVYPATR